METLSSFPDFSQLHAQHPGLRGVLFDMDGTLFQTEEIHAEVLRAMARDWRVRPPFPAHELEERCKGMADRQVLEWARSWEGFPAAMDEATFVNEKNQRLLQHIPRCPLETWCAPALLHFLSQAQIHGILLAIVTSSERVITEKLVQTAQVEKFFDLIITLQDVRFAKPHPWPYLQAMQQLGLGPRETIVFEDSAPGLAAAQAAGVRVIEAQWWKDYSSGRKI